MDGRSGRPGPPGGPRRGRPARAFLLLLVCAVLCLPGAVQAGEIHDPALDQPVSLSLTGWGWCFTYKDIANVTLDLDGAMLTRLGGDETKDLQLNGTLRFNLPDRTDNFNLELWGTKVRSVFYLKQVTGGDQPLVELDGTWLEETGYVACEGVLALPTADFVAVPYVLVMRTPEAEVPERNAGAGWVGDWEFIVQKGTGAFDRVADELARGGEAVKEQLGGFLTRVTVIIREVREFGVPYFV